MAVNLQYMHITVDDVDAALGFYRDALGLEERNNVENDGFRWVTLGFAEQPGVEIVLSQPGAGRSAEDAASISQLLAKGVLQQVVFSTDDLDSTFEKARVSGTGEVLQEPMQQPWGPRDCAFRDPAGNMVRISQTG